MILLSAKFKNLRSVRLSNILGIKYDILQFLSFILLSVFECWKNLGGILTVEFNKWNSKILARPATKSLLILFNFVKFYTSHLEVDFQEKNQSHYYIYG